MQKRIGKPRRREVFDRRHNNRQTEKIFRAPHPCRSASFKTRNATNAANLRARTEVPFHIKPHTCRNRKIRRLSARLPQNRKQTLPDTFQNKKRKIPFADADAKPLRENSALFISEGAHCRLAHSPTASAAESLRAFTAKKSQNPAAVGFFTISGFQHEQHGEHF